MALPPARPPDEVFVLPNKYEPGRAHIVVYNWSHQPSVTVALRRAGLAAGQCFEVRDVQDLFGAPVASGRYRGRGAVTIDLRARPAAAPLGWSGTVSNTAPEFGVFLVLPQPTVVSNEAPAGSCASSRLE